MNKEIWVKKIRYIRGLKDEELIRLELGMDCKPYLVKSRTAMLAKTVRVFEKSEKQQLFYYMDIVNKRIAELPEEEKTVQVNKKNKKNYMKEVLELYGRKDK